MTVNVLGIESWDMVRDKDGHRDYHVTWKIETSLIADGPQVILNAPGLPAIGSTWSIGNDVDDWAFCIPETSITPILTGEPNRHWLLTQTFTTKPPWRCQDTDIENPLMEPPRVSGSYVKFVKEVRYDRHGELIKSSSHEVYTGPDVEFDDNRPTVSIEVTSLTLPLDVVTSMVDTVNDANLWGLSPRKIKLSNVTWTRRLYGTCTFYYTIGMEFDINFRTFDRTLVDVGTRHLNPEWLKKHNPATGNPWTPDDDVHSFTLPDGRVINYSPPVKLKDVPYAFTKIGDNNAHPSGWHVLDGKGRIWPGHESGIDPGEVEVEYYPESNFLLLGIPTTLGT